MTPVTVDTNSTSSITQEQQEVVKEHLELHSRLANLDAFILDNPEFLSLPEEEQSRRKAQSSVMALYLDILADRIAHF